VVGITTQKRFLSSDGRQLQGIGFALSSNDLLSVLGRFYPNLSLAGTPQPEHRGKGKVSIIADLDAADIYIDGKFVGNAPATFSLPAALTKLKSKAKVEQHGRESWRFSRKVM
jgi:hypothetical protein